MSELVLPLWPVGWVMIVVNGLVTTLVIDRVVVASTLDEEEPSTLEGLHGVPDADAVGVATADESEIGCPGRPGTDDTVPVGATEDSGRGGDGENPIVLVIEFPVLDGVYPGPGGVDEPVDGPAVVGTLLLSSTLLEVLSALEEPTLGGWVKPGIIEVRLVPVGRIAELEDGRPGGPEGMEVLEEPSLDVS